MLVRHTSRYLVASVATAALGFLSAAVFTRLLTPQDYGVYVVGFGAASFISAIAFTWPRYSVMRFESEGGATDVRMTSLAAYGISAAGMPIVFGGLHFAGGFSWDRAALAITVALSSSLFDLSLEILRSRLRVRAFVAASVFRSATAFAVCLVIAELGGGGRGQLVGAAAAYGLAALASSPAVWRAPRAPIAPAKLKLFFALGAPVTLAGLIVTFQATFDRLFIAWRFDDVSAGLYGASADIVRQIVLVPAGSVAAAAFPLSVRAFATGDAEATRRQLERTGELLIAILAPAALGLSLTAPYLASFLLGPAFRGTAAAIMPILAFAWMCQSVSQTYIHVSFHLKMRQDLTILHGLVTLACNAALLWPMTSAFGLNGAAGALLGSEVVGAVVGYFLTFRAHPLPALSGPATRVGAACGAMGLVVLALERALPDYSAPAFAILATSGAVAYGVAALSLDVCQSRGVVGQALRGAQARAGRFAA